MRGRGAGAPREPLPPLTTPALFFPSLGNPQACCYICKQILEVEDFAVDASKASGRKSICRACDRAKSRAYYLANRERKLAAANERARRLRDGSGGA